MTPPEGSGGAEARRLRARMEELEEQLAAQARTTNALVARSQDRLYWLERWHVDLDDVMRSPRAAQALRLTDRIRALTRSGTRARSRPRP